MMTRSLLVIHGLRFVISTSAGTNRNELLHKNVVANNLLAVS